MSTDRKETQSNPPTTVCSREADARHALERGHRVILILPLDAPAPDLGDPAHLGFLIGDPEDPATREAAHAMAADLWPAGS